MLCCSAALQLQQGEGGLGWAGVEGAPEQILLSELLHKRLELLLVRVAPQVQHVPPAWSANPGQAPPWPGGGHVS